MTPAQLIGLKRDGRELSDRQISELINGYVAGNVPDYQMSAFAMAVYFQGMTAKETAALTTSLLDSGQRLAWPNDMSCVDKHSTGGLGDKVSLVLAPMLACCGLHVPMISGRGLGTTGGTLDKLESIPGFRTDLSISEITTNTSEIGCVITGATDELAPADRKLYALRDVTGTVPSIPLIVSSILSKKLAESTSSLVFDVKCGSGAVMKTAPQARRLAESLVTVASAFGVKTTALITQMSEPLGRAVGNAIEVKEAIQTLRGGGPADVLELSIRLGCELLIAENLVTSEKRAHLMLLEKIRSGTAFEKFQEMVSAQGGTLNNLNLAPLHTVVAQLGGYVHDIDSEALGHLVKELGGGRQQIGQDIDHAVGIELLVKVGQQIDSQQPIANVYSRSDINADRISTMIKISDEPSEKRSLVIDQVR